MSDMHVYAHDDKKDHVVNKDAKCWCDPHIEVEGRQLVHAKRKGMFKKVGPINRTIIHGVLRPMIEGVKRDIRKVRVVSGELVRVT